MHCDLVWGIHLNILSEEIRKMRELIRMFIESVSKGEVEIYNEFSLQHELGLFLRTHLAACKVQFERNVSFFFGNKTQFPKRESDVSVYSGRQEELRFAIEVKYPRNGQYPEQMFAFCLDLAFVEQLKRAGFQETGVLILAEDPLFYQGPIYNDSAKKIYGYFRGCHELHGVIGKPTGRKNSEVQLEGHYRVNWQPVLNSLRYTYIDASNN